MCSGELTKEMPVKNNLCQGVYLLRTETGWRVLTEKVIDDGHQWIEFVDYPNYVSAVKAFNWEEANF